MSIITIIISYDTVLNIKLYGFEILSWLCDWLIVAFVEILRYWIFWLSFLLFICCKWCFWLWFCHQNYAICLFYWATNKLKKALWHHLRFLQIVIILKRTHLLFMWLSDLSNWYAMAEHVSHTFACLRLILG